MGSIFTSTEPQTPNTQRSTRYSQCHPCSDVPCSWAVYVSIFSGISILNHCFLGWAAGGVFCHCPSPELHTCRQGEWPHQSIKLQKNVSTAVSDLAFLDCTVALNKSLRNKLSSWGWCWGGERQVMKDPGFYSSHQTEIYQCSHQLVISDLTWQARLLVNFLHSRKGADLLCLRLHSAALGAVNMAKGCRERRGNRAGETWKKTPLFYRCVSLV